MFIYIYVYNRHRTIVLAISSVPPGGTQVYYV